jgi:hypothetical protein
MSPVPECVMTVVQAYLRPLLLWFSQRVYSELVQGAGDHLLVKVQAHLDCARLEQACAGYHHAAGPGAPPTHSVPRLVRALLVKYLFHWSLRQLEFQIRYNLLVKWFVGYPLWAAGPDHTTLERFEVWVMEQQHRTFFDEVLRQIDQDFPAERQQPQVGDTFALRANAASESTVRLIRHTCQRLLWVLAAADPLRHQAVIAQLDQEALFGAADERSEYHLDAAGRQARLQTTVTAALCCAQLVQAQLAVAPRLPTATRAPVQEWLDRLHKVLGDEVQVTRDAQGQVTQVTRLPDDQKGSYRLGSATDPAATYRVHGEKKCDLGYNVQVAATRHFIREIQAATGAQPDPVTIPAVLAAQQTYHACCPPKLIYDAAAGTGKTHAQVAQATHDQTQLVAPLIPYAKRTDRFTPEDFTLAADRAALTCPHGVTSTVAYRAGGGQGLTFRFTAAQCAGCRLWGQCRDPQVDPTHMRQVFISDFRAYVEVARAYNQTAAFKADMKLRPLIERLIAMLTRYDGAREAQRRGEDAADFQAKMCATARNLRQWVGALDQQMPVSTRA